LNSNSWVTEGGLKQRLEEAAANELAVIQLRD
jgi:hypothetical protein